MTLYFPAYPNLKPVADNDELRELEHDYIGPAINGKVTEVKTGFQIDGASIPRFFWRMVGHPLQLPLLAAAVLHDGEYMAELYPRKECDKRFVEAMKMLGICWLKRSIIYSAVRIGGGVVWKKHTAETLADAEKFVAEIKN